MNKFSVSVVIPTFNMEATIRESVQSVLEQNYAGVIEVIVVDDGSEDGTKIILEEMLSVPIKNNRILKVIYKENNGVSSARNEGIEESKFDWIALLDSDDFWHRNKLLEQVNIVNLLDIKFVGTVYQRNFYPFKKGFETFSLSTVDVLKKWYPNTPTWLIKKNLIVSCGGFDEKQKYAEDGDLLLKILQHTDVHVVNQPLVFPIIHKLSYGDSGLSANMHGMYSGELYALKGTLDRKQIPYHKYLTYYLWITARYYKRLLISFFRGLNV